MQIHLGNFIEKESLNFGKYFSIMNFLNKISMVIITMEHKLNRKQATAKYACKSPGCIVSMYGVPSP